MSIITGKWITNYCTFISYTKYQIKYTIFSNKYELILIHAQHVFRSFCQQSLNYKWIQT